jgi:hypothetical protein
MYHELIQEVQKFALLLCIAIGTTEYCLFATVPDIILTLYIHPSQ